MELNPYRDYFEFEKVVKNFSKFEYLVLDEKPSKKLITNFMLKLPNLRYFWIEERGISIDSIIEYFKQNSPYLVKKRKLMAKDG